MEELEICQRERDLLTKKLHIHLDRWTLDKIVFRETAAKGAKDCRIHKAEHAYEIARMELCIGSLQHQLLLLKCKLESAIEDVELREIQFSSLQAQLAEERKCLDSANRKLQRVDALFSVKVASETKKRTMEIERRIHHLQNVAEGGVRDHKAELGRVAKYVSLVAELKEEREQLLRQNSQLKVEEEKFALQNDKLNSLSEERDNLLAEQDHWIQDQAKLRALMLERDELLAARDRCIVLEQDLQDVLTERDILRAQERGWLSRDDEMRQVFNELKESEARGRSQDHDDLVTERDDLKSKLELFHAKHERETRALVRERDFVWSQMKLIEGKYEDRIKQMAGQLQRERLEFDRLQKSKQEVEAGHNDAKLELIILKLGAKHAEDLAMQRQKAAEADVKEPHEMLEEIREEKRSIAGEAPKASKLNVNTQNESLPKQGDSPSYQTHEAGSAAGVVKEVPEVLNTGEGPALDQEMLLSQVEQAAEADKNEDKLSLKRQVADLRRENDNLRRDTENLKALYAELEESQHRMRQKPSKVTRRESHRDPTSRNLKLELEAVAAGCPSTTDPMSHGKAHKLRKRRPLMQNGATSVKSGQKEKDVVNDPDLDGAECPGKREISPRQTRSSRRNSAGKKWREELDTSGLSPTFSGLKDQVDAVQNNNPERSGAEPLQKRPRIVDKENLQIGKDHGPVLPARPPRSRPKSAGRTSSATKSASRESGGRTLFWSPSKTTKMMANLFSNSFSVPKLKNVHSPMGFRTR